MGAMFQLIVRQKPLLTRAENLLLVASGAELSIPSTDSAVLATGVACGANHERVARVGGTISAVGSGAPALAVKVADGRILEETIGRIRIQYVFCHVLTIRSDLRSKRSSASRR